MRGGPPVRQRQRHGAGRQDRGLQGLLERHRPQHRAAASPPRRLAAIDDAIADGVDVINFSISGATNTVVDAVEYAFLGAAAAGVFVATSAGNSGPTASTVAHNSPWLTTVAASTHVNYENTVVLGNGSKYKGASIADTAVPSVPLVNSTAIGAAGVAATDAHLCAPEQPRPR